MFRWFGFLVFLVGFGFIFRIGTSGDFLCWWDVLVVGLSCMNFVFG